MKKKFVLGSQVLLVSFVFLLIIFLAYAMSADSEVIDLSGYVAIPFIIVTCLTIVSFAVMFVCEVIELIKEKNKKVFFDIIGFTLLLSVMLYLYDTVFENNGGSYRWYLITSFIIACFTRTLNYWKRIKKES